MSWSARLGNPCSTESPTEIPSAAVGISTGQLTQTTRKLQGLSENSGQLEFVLKAHDPTDSSFRETVFFDS